MIAVHLRKKRGGNITPLAMVGTLELEQSHVTVTLQSLNFFFPTPSLL